MMEKTRIMYRHREYALALRGDTYLFIRDFEEVKGQNPPWKFSDGFETKNPILAWSTYHGAVDSDVRRRMGDMLEAQGHNRFTGEPLAVSMVPLKPEGV